MMQSRAKGTLLLGFVLISLMDRVRTNATLFAEHSARIKRTLRRAGHTRRFALEDDTDVVSRFSTDSFCSVIAYVIFQFVYIIYLM